MSSFMDMGKRIFWQNNWKTVIFRGILMTLLGVCFIANPMATVKVLTYLFGIMLVVIGIMMLSTSGKVTMPVLRTSMQTIAVLLLLVGLVMMLIPIFAAVMVVIIIAFLSLGHGIQQIMAAGVIKSARGYLWLSGILSLLFGVVIILSPGNAVSVFGFIIGIYLLAFGIFTLSLGGALRQKNR